MEESLIQAPTLPSKHVDCDGNAVFAETVDAACGLGVGVACARNHAGNTLLQDKVNTGWRPALVVARFQVYVERSSL